MKKIVRYLSYAFVAFTVLFSCMYALPTSVDEVGWESWGCERKDLLSCKTTYEDMVQWVFEPVCSKFGSYLNYLVTIKQGYAWGKSMNRKSDAELLHTMDWLYNQVKARDDGDPEQLFRDLKWFGQYKIDIYNERFIGALSAVFEFCMNRDVSIDEIKGLRVSIENRLYELEADANHFPREERVAARNFLYLFKKHERDDFPTTSVKEFLAFLDDYLAEIKHKFC